jgi:hypothetical protein
MLLIVLTIVSFGINPIDACGFPLFILYPLRSNWQLELCLFHKVLILQ